MDLPTSLQPRMVPTRLVEMTELISSSGAGMRSLVKVMPAQLTRMSISGWHLRRDFQEEGEDTSRATAAWGGQGCGWAARSIKSRKLLEEEEAVVEAMITDAPSEANRWDMARPMPFVPPVMRAILPFRVWRVIFVRE